MSPNILLTIEEELAIFVDELGFRGSRCDIYFESEPFPGLEDHLLDRPPIDFHNPSKNMLAQAKFII